MRTQRWPWLRFLPAIALAVATAACTTTASPTTNPAGPEASVAESSASASLASGTSVEGSLTTSGLYEATWSWTPGDSVEVGDLGGITLTSDTGTYANITVMGDGSIRFGSAAPELVGASDFRGTGAQVTFGTGLGGDVYLCSFTLDNDLRGTDSSILHIKGTLTVHSDDEFTHC